MRLWPGSVGIVAMETVMKTLVVTGGSTGIGAATAQAFVAHGWQVLSLARRACPV